MQMIYARMLLYLTEIYEKKYGETGLM